MSSQAGHIPSLDGIRAIAAVIVFVAHAGLEKSIPGGFGVTIFFFLSGYLITTLLRREFQHSGDISLRKFYLRRVYRILPPMYITLAVAVLLGYLFHNLGDVTLGAVLAQIFQLTNYYYIFNGLDHLIPLTNIMWSLAVEEHFYLLYPLALLLLLRRFDCRKVGKLLLLSCVLVLLWRCCLVFWLRPGEAYTNMATDARLDSLLFGCIMGVYLNPVLDRQDALSERQWLVTLLGAFAVLLFCMVNRNPQFRETLRYSLQGIALFPVFYCAVRYPHWPAFAWLESRPVRYVGTISYTFYLIHFESLYVAGKIVGDSEFWQGCLAGAFTLAFAAAMYSLVERRLGALRRQLHGAE